MLEKYFWLASATFFSAACGLTISKPCGTGRGEKVIRFSLATSNIDQIHHWLARALDQEMLTSNLCTPLTDEHGCFPSCIKYQKYKSSNEPAKQPPPSNHGNFILFLNATLAAWSHAVRLFRIWRKRDVCTCNGVNATLELVPEDRSLTVDLPPYVMLCFCNVRYKHTAGVRTLLLGDWENIARPIKPSLFLY